MAYTFGAGTGDDVTWGVGNSFGATAISCLVCGWWYPTTLTATRGLWSAGTVFGAEIDSTTDELRLRVDATTDGQWTTSGVDLAVDTWHFLAFLNTNLNTGAASAWRVWRGTIDTAPTECTVTVATTRVGNSTGVATFYVGNKGTDVLAFQGDIGEVVTIASGNTAGATTSPFTIATNGAISQVEADFVRDRFVLPIWAGNVDQVVQRALVHTQSTQACYWPADVDTQVFTTAATSTNTRNIVPTVNGATPSQRRAPRTLAGWRFGPSALRR